MRTLVTGAAGFIGSHLAERLAAEGHDVRAVDCLTPYYDVSHKEANLKNIIASDACEVRHEDLRSADLGALLDGVEVVFHHAGQPGVRASWRSGFASYVEHNVLVTQRLLEAVQGSGVRRFVFASSSSVYGNAPAFPTTEQQLPAPHSPYGVTKLAAEHLCMVYARNWGVPIVALRYFTVYGPRQRPDMAMHRLVEAALDGTPFPVYGDGSQIRDFTYVDDVVRANLLAASADVPPGTPINIAGGSATTLSEIIETVGDLVGCPIELRRHRPAPGDVDRTGGSISRAVELLGWRPGVPLREGLTSQVAWHRARHASTERAAR
jgi:nucleoside-diphosphate-sugar epimerase